MSSDDSTAKDVHPLLEVRDKLDDKIKRTKERRNSADWPDDRDKHQMVLDGLRSAKTTVDTAIEEHGEYRKPRTLKEWEESDASGWTPKSDTCSCPVCTNEAGGWCDDCSGCNNVTPDCGQYIPEEHGLLKL